MTENLKRKKGLTTYYNEFLKGATKGQRQNTNHLRYFKRLSILNHCSLFFTNKWAVERKVVICITKRKPYVISVEFLMWFPLFSPKAFFFLMGHFCVSNGWCWISTLSFGSWQLLCLSVLWNLRDCRDLMEHQKDYLSQAMNVSYF